MAAQEAPVAGRRSRTRLVLQGVLSLVLVAAIFYYLFTKIDLAQVWAAITAMTWTELATYSHVIPGLDEQAAETVARLIPMPLG